MIPRSAFALAVKISAARLSEYENGRVPVPYGVFKAIHHRYFINPEWLVNGNGPPTLEAPLNLVQADAGNSDRDLFSAVYARDLRVEMQVLEASQVIAFAGPGGVGRAVAKCLQMASGSIPVDLAPVGVVEKQIARLQKLVEQVKSKYKRGV